MLGNPAVYDVIIPTIDHKIRVRGEWCNCDSTRAGLSPVTWVTYKGLKHIRALASYDRLTGSRRLRQPRPWGVLRHTRIESSPQSRRARVSCPSPASLTRWVCEYFLTRFYTWFLRWSSKKNANDCCSCRVLYHVLAHVLLLTVSTSLGSLNCVDHVISDQHERRGQILDSIKNWSTHIKQFHQVKFLIVEAWKMVLVFIQMCWRPSKRLKSLTLKFSSKLVKGYIGFNLESKIT